MQRPHALVDYGSDSHSNSDSEPEPLAPVAKKRPASSLASHDQQPPLKKANIIRVQAPEPLPPGGACATSSLFSGAKATPSAGSSGLFAFLPKPSNAKPAPSPAPATTAAPPPTKTEGSEPADSAASPASSSWRKLPPPSVVVASAKSKAATPKPASASSAPPPSSSASTPSASIPPLAAPASVDSTTATSSALANQPAISFFSFEEDDDDDPSPALGPSLPPPASSDPMPTVGLPTHKPYFTPPTHASPYAYSPAAPSSSSLSPAATDLDGLAQQLGVDRRDLAKLGISSKQRLGGIASNVHTVSVRDALQHEDLETLAAVTKAAAPKPIHEHISSSTKLNITQLARKAVTQHSEMQAVFAAQRAKKKSGNTKYGF